MSSQNINLQNLNLNPSRSFIGGALKYFKQNATSCLGTLAIAAPLIHGGFYLADKLFDYSDYDNNFYARASEYCLVSMLCLSINAIVNLGSNLIKNSLNYYNRIKQSKYNFLPMHFLPKHNNIEPLKQPYKYQTFIQTIKNICKTSAIAAATGLAINAYFDLNNIPAKPLFELAAVSLITISSIVTNILVNRKAKKE